MSAVLRVIQPGLFTTVQDLGRPHAIGSGVPPGGAMDRFAHRAANLLAGNEGGAATLECTVIGPQLEVERACLIAIAGADLDPRVDGEAAPMWTAIKLREGDRLTFGPRRSGTRAYIALAGGVAGDRWLGSLSTSIIAGRGGMHGRPLAKGDVISAASGAAAGQNSTAELAPGLRPDYRDHTLHAIAGPHFNRLSADGRRLLFSAAFHVSPDSDRMGYRLEGAQLDASGDEVLSFGLAAGAIQVPSGRQPILLMADHQTAGGYPVVATVVSASLPIAAQLAPGDELQISEVTFEDALQMRAAQQAVLATLLASSMTAS